MLVSRCRRKTLISVWLQIKRSQMNTECPLSARKRCSLRSASRYASCRMSSGSTRAAKRQSIRKLIIRQSRSRCRVNASVSAVWSPFCRRCCMEFSRSFCMGRLALKQTCRTRKHPQEIRPILAYVVILWKTREIRCGWRDGLHVTKRMSPYGCSRFRISVRAECAPNTVHTGKGSERP